MLARHKVMHRRRPGADSYGGRAEIEMQEPE